MNKYSKIYIAGHRGLADSAIVRGLQRQGYTNLPVWPRRNYDLNNSHVLPALIRKMHEAKVADAKEMVLWGSGTPKREFLYVDDLANALVFLATLDAQRYDALVEPSRCPLINIGSGEDLTIRELAETIADVVGYQGRFTQDTSKPDGTMRKIMDVSKIRAWAGRRRFL